MEKTIDVVPVEGRSLPRENSKRRITGPMSVPDTAYYRRAIERGDLAVAPKKARTGKEG